MRTVFFFVALNQIKRERERKKKGERERRKERSTSECWRVFRHRIDANKKDVIIRNILNLYIVALNLVLLFVTITVVFGSFTMESWMVSGSGSTWIEVPFNSFYSNSFRLMLIRGRIFGRIFPKMGQFTVEVQKIYWFETFPHLHSLPTQTISWVYTTSNNDNRCSFKLELLWLSLLLRQRRWWRL